MNKIPLAKEGLPFILGSALLTVLLWKWQVVLGVLGAVMTVFILSFFRDPAQNPPALENTFYSPASGTVTKVEKAASNPYWEGSFVKVSIFLSVFDVHVNRASMNGLVKKILYRPGKFIAANHPQADSVNESNVLVIESPRGIYLLRQIAGLIARRIVCDVQEGDRVTQGKRFGMIRFGSGMELYMPPSAVVQVSVGQKVTAGKTVLGAL